jgi:hypothetical protein
LVILGLTLVVSALRIANTSAVDGNQVRAQVVQAAQTFLTDHPAEPPGPPQEAPLDPAAQSVQSYLRAHEITPPLWQQLRDRVWRFLRGQ